jgi:hypothetical protein
MERKAAMTNDPLEMELRKRLKALEIRVDDNAFKYTFVNGYVVVEAAKLLLLAEMAEQGISMAVSEMETPHLSAKVISCDFILNAKESAAMWLREHSYRVPWNRKTSKL